MTAIIVGLGAVVFLVVAVVGIGIRSGRRRESNLSPERIKAMAEGKVKRKLTRPVEDTFFESFPEGFDSLDDEPERPRASRPSTGNRSGQRAGGRKNRGADEWGDSDDYDDDYWSRVRADEDGFGGSIAAQKGAPRPADEPASAGKGERGPAAGQAPLPTRPGKNLADLVETARATPSSAAAEEKTVRFSSQPGATPAGALPGMSPPGSATGGAKPAGPGARNAGPAARPGPGARPGPAGGPGPRPGAPNRPGAAAGRPASGPGARQPMGGPAGGGTGPMTPGATGPGSAVPGSRKREGRGSRGARPAAASARPDPLADPLGTTGSRRAADPLATGPRPAASANDPLGASGSRRTGDPLATGPRPAASASDPLATGPRPAASASDPLATGPRPAASVSDPLATGPRPAAASARPDPLADPLGVTSSRRSGGRRGSRRAPAGPFQEGRGGATSAPLDTGRRGSSDASPTTTGPLAGSASGSRSSESPAATGPFPGTRPPGSVTPGAPDPLAVPGAPEVGMPEPRRSPSEPFPAMPPASATPAGLMADPPAATTGRRTPTPTGPAPSSAALPETGVFSMPPIAPAASAAPAATPAATTPSAQPGWTGIRDILDDDPPPAASSRETWSAASAAGYQTSFSDGPGSSRPTPPVGSVGSAGSSYEVSPGWATIDEADTTGPSPASATATGPAPAVSRPDGPGGDDVLSGGYYGIEGGGSPSAPVAWPERDGQGNWPSYKELYGDTESPGPEKTTRGRHGGRRRASDPDFPDYYR